MQTLLSQEEFNQSVVKMLRHLHLIVASTNPGVVKAESEKFTERLYEVDEYAFRNVMKELSKLSTEEQEAVFRNRFGWDAAMNYGRERARGLPHETWKEGAST